jgi:archaea-specific DNA-binding protein
MEVQEDSMLFIGNKPVMNYVLACLTLFQNGTGAISLKARGRAITRAVDVVQILSNRYMPELTVKKINIDTEQVRDVRTGAMTYVSSMEIRMSR